MTNSRLAVAAHIVAVLASKGEGACVSSSAVAQSVNTNPVVIRRILGQLIKAGIVGCDKGKGGGARLLKCPEDVSLLDLSRALGEEKLFGLHRKPANPRCKVSCGMKEALMRAFARAEKAASQALSGVSVKDLLG